MRSGDLVLNLFSHSCSCVLIISCHFGEEETWCQSGLVELRLISGYAQEGRQKESLGDLELGQFACERSVVLILQLDGQLDDVLQRESSYNR